MGTAFIPLGFSVINGGLGLWVLRFSKVLAGPEMMRFAPRRVSEDLVRGTVGLLLYLVLTVILSDVIIGAVRGGSRGGFGGGKRF